MNVCYVLLDKPTDSEEIVTGEKAAAMKEGASVLQKSQFLKKTLVRQAKVTEIESKDSKPPTSDSQPGTW